MGKVDNATEAAKTLQDITNFPFSFQTLRQHLKSRGMRPVVKRKCPLLKPHHQRARLEFAERHAEWTLEDWKGVIWSDDTKINCLGSDGRKYVWKNRDVRDLKAVSAPMFSLTLPLTVARPLRKRLTLHLAKLYLILPSTAILSSLFKFPN